MINNKLKLKICGMRERDNVVEIAALKPDYMGFIFYPKSPRFVDTLAWNVVEYLHERAIVAVAVFVNASVESIAQIVEVYGFTHIQLHGSESPEVCAKLRAKGLTVLKAFAIAEPSDLEATKVYQDCCDYFLFDAKTSSFGGSGHQFDWNILFHYSGKTPFFLSGGIGSDDVAQVRNFKHPRLAGIDLNSRFEIQPALKDVGLLQSFINQLISEK